VAFLTVCHRLSLSQWNYNHSPATACHTSPLVRPNGQARYNLQGPLYYEGNLRGNLLTVTM
jgi:hypothetical protein